MLNRRKLLLAVTMCVVAMGFVASVVAEELLGVMTKVDVEGKKITVVKKDGDDEKEIVITITDDTEQVKKKGETSKSTWRSWRRVSKRRRMAGRRGSPSRSTTTTRTSPPRSKSSGRRGLARRRTIDLGERADRTILSARSGLIRIVQQQACWPVRHGARSRLCSSG